MGTTSSPDIRLCIQRVEHSFFWQFVFRLLFLFVVRLFNPPLAFLPCEE
jgi:hypothetical protein